MPDSNLRIIRRLNHSDQSRCAFRQTIARNTVHDREQVCRSVGLRQNVDLPELAVIRFRRSDLMSFAFLLRAIVRASLKGRDAILLTADPSARAANS